MLDERLGLWDRIMLLGSFLGVVLFSFALAREDWLVRFMRGKQSGKVLGYSMAAKEDVRRRLGTSLTWYPVQEKDEIFERDSIFTGPDSELSLAFLNKQTLQLGANTLVVLRSQGDEVLLDLQLGSVVSYAPAPQVVKILHEGRVTELKPELSGKPIRIKKGVKGDLSVSSEVTKIQFGSLKDRKNINLNEQLKIQKNQLSLDPITQIKPITLFHPKDGANLPTQLVSFQWDMVPGVDLYVLEVSSGADFADAKSIKVKDFKTEMELEPGNYQWRVQASKDTEIKSNVAQFTVGNVIPRMFHGPERPPELDLGLTPEGVSAPKHVAMKYKQGVDVRSPASVASKLMNPPILSWQPLAGAHDYVVELDVNDKFENPMTYQTQGLTKFAWREARPGKIYWRVTAVNLLGDKSKSSEIRTLKVGLAAPDLEVPSIDNDVVERPDHLTNPKEVTVQWQPLPWASNYEVKVGDQVSTTKKNSAQVQVQPNTSTTIEVVALDEKAQPLSERAIQSVQFQRELKIVPPVVTLPADNTTVVVFGGVRMEPLLFSWKPLDGVKEYDLQFASDPEFTKLLAERKVLTNSFVMKERLPETQAYWRVRSRFQDRVSEWSQPRKYQLQVNEVEK